MLLKQKHHLDAARKGFFPIGAIAMSERAQEAFDKERELSGSKDRLENQEHTKGKKVTGDTMRDTYLYLHKMQQFGNVPDSQKNHNVTVIGMGMGTVQSRYPLPLSDVSIDVHTKFDAIRREVRTAILLTEEAQA